jgi:hypothetical protein
VTPRAQRAYLSLASVFLAIGGTGVGLGLVDAAFGLDLFRGNPAPTALFVLAIGAALRWTAARAEVRADDAADRRDGDSDGPRSPD